jgi:uncharacterized membrane protein
MMALGMITIPMSDWVWAAGAAAVVMLVLLAWTYRRVPGQGMWHRTAFALKLLGVLLLILCLVEPVYSSRRAKSGANLFLVVADNSAGLAIRDQGSDRTRGQILQEAIQKGRTGWLGKLGEDFQVRSYLFDTRLHRTTDFTDLAFDGKATSIAGTLRTIAERYRGRPIAGVMLLTDGCATDAGDLPADGSGMPPIYPVVIGQDQAEKDIAVTNVTVSQTAFEDAPVTIQAEVEASGFAGRTVAIDLTDAAGRRVERQQWAVRRGEDRQSLRFRLKPDKSGVLFYRVRAAELSSAEPSGGNAIQTEATLANNERTVVVDRGQGPYRILYLAGRPNWEYKFLQRAVAEDTQVQLVGLIRVARREPKFDWRGHAGESSNPLYRGFDPNDQETAEQYDQPVLVRLNTRDQNELDNGFPKTAEGLYDYQAVIIDDIEADFFSRDQMELLRRFVLERGGSFLMLGGKDSFQQGKYDRTPIAALLPVYLNPAETSTANAQSLELRMGLTREGWLQPWVRLRDNEQDERMRLSEMPNFRVFNQTGSPKAGARVLEAIGSDSTRQAPLLVVQRLGNGQSGAIMLGDVWRWGMQRPEQHPDLDKFWRQTLRWMVADVPNRISIQAADRSDQAGQAVVLQVRARNKAFQPLDGVRVTIDINVPGETSLHLPTEPVLNDSGLFQTTYMPRVSGGYLADARVLDAQGVIQGQAQLGWTSELEAREFASIKTNRPLMEKIARETSGRVVELSDLDAFARGLPNQDVPISEVRVRPLWDLRGVLPTIFALSLMCFVGEWALRRWKGLP